MFKQGSNPGALKEYRRYKKGYASKWLSKRRIKAFYNVTMAPDFRQGARSLMQVCVKFLIYISYNIQ